MSTSVKTIPDANAAGAGHVVRFYQDDAVLMEEVADFLDRGLREGGTAIVIATPAHLSALRQQLMGLGALQGQRGWFTGELVMLDAAEVLAQIIVEGWPDEQRFEAVVGQVVRGALVRGGPVHAFGEMVALLCEEGRYDAAVRLEQLWNGLAQSCRFALFCAYPWRLFPSGEHARAFQQICGEHDHVHPSGPAGAAERHDVQLRVGALERENLALRAELARAREAADTLRHRERELADFVENAAEGLHRVGPDGTILWANKAELALLGYRWEEYVGHHIGKFHVDSGVIGDILVRLQAGQTLYDVPARLRCSDGSIKHVVINSNGCFENGRLRYTRCFTRDATERHLLEQAHREREALVAELSRANSAKDEFLAMLAHELRNPLAPIAAAAQLLSLTADDAQRVRTTAAVITRQVGHMTGLIDDLLDVARVTRGLVVLDKCDADLRDIVHEAAEQVMPHVRARGHQLTIDLPGEIASISCDRKRIIQVLVNIITNASKFTPDGGRIAVAVQLHAGVVELIVTDNGIGMDAELVTRVFDLFVQGQRTLDRTQGGLGIGLALARSLVESHGGAISAHSDGHGKGSRFVVRLPRMDNEADARPSPPVDAVPARHATALRVLVVDDNRDAADALAGLLSAMGYDANALYSSVAALEAAAIAPPHVFLLDIGLPDIDGISLAGRLRAMPSAARAVLVAVTGYGQQRDRDVTRTAGFEHHLVKPVDTAALAAILNAAAAAVTPGGGAPEAPA
ncbi:PAS domain S-box-containing protein [Pseudoduganella flava]|uniref:histidine kinase n=1 Tax=Pseudoduganella flava TaxID=871742 RepID=A0A562Q055_9BURK|nr:ATP-binding protein [Pseudoduganella flava]QGZ38407.1 response regulator [Pseudoduganella flava]TWI50047.1 PAS domain S-box-containing protein [Pseudoduganella flava]